jgi:hypothetical protein
MERPNLASAEPEILQRLRDAYTTWFPDVSTTRPDNFAPPRIVIGSNQETTTVLTRQEWRVPVKGDNGRTGVWLLRAERDATYSVELRWPKPVSIGTVEFRAGGVTRTVPVPEPTDRVIIGEVRIHPATSNYPLPTCTVRSPKAPTMFFLSAASRLQPRPNDTP